MSTKYRIFILLQLCFLLYYMPMVTKACPPPDCGDDCLYWNSELGYCDFIDQCAVWQDCGGWCCDCVDCECLANYYDNWCSAYWGYGPEYYCWHGCVCLAGSITSIGANKSVVAVNEDVTFTAYTYPDWIAYDANWTFGGTPSTGSGNTFTTKWSSAGWQTVMASIGGISQNKSIPVVKVGSIIKKNTNPGDSGPLYTTSSSIDLEAVPYPSGTAFPIDPTWWCSDYPGTNMPQISTDGDYATISGMSVGKYIINAKCGEYDTGKTIEIYHYSIDITNANVTSGSDGVINVNIQPSGYTGTLKLELTGSGSPHTILNASRTSGNLTESFNIPNLSTGEYTKVKATWTIGSFAPYDEYNYHIKVLGVYRHSTYNLPNETYFSGTNESFYYTTGNCTVTACTWNTNGSAKADFLDAEELNGSGYSTNLGYVTTEEWCQSHNYPPPGGGTPHLLRDLSIIGGCPACTSLPMTAYETVAVNPSHPDLDCGDNVFVYNVGVVTVTDKGGGLSTAQLDHYIGPDDGSTPSDIGNLMTIKLF